MVEPKQRTRNRRTAAFTLIEIIVVVVILAVAALIAVPMMSSAADIQVRSAANRMAADLEYAKNMAITHQKPYTVIFDNSATNSNGYEIQNSDGIITHPVSQQEYDIRFSAERSISRVRISTTGVAIDPDDNTNAVTFDYLGTPHSGLTTGTPLNSGQITLRDSAASFSLMVNIEPMTGYVTIE